MKSKEARNAALSFFAAITLTGSADHEVSHPFLQQNTSPAIVIPERSVEDEHEKWHVITHGNRERLELSLTFDCGASGIPTPTILEALRINDVKTTFFLTGKWVERYSDLAKQIVADGHEIANHTWSHPDLRKLSNEQIIQEMERAEEIIVAITGQETRPRYRPPFGYWNKRVAEIVASVGWEDNILWSAASLDYIVDITPRVVKDNILKAAENGAIIVNHCGSPQMAQVLPETIDTLKEQGFKLTTVSDLLRE